MSEDGDMHSTSRTMIKVHHVEHDAASETVHFNFVQH